MAKKLISVSREDLEKVASLVLEEMVGFRSDDFHPDRFACDICDEWVLAKNGKLSEELVHKPSCVCLIALFLVIPEAELQGRRV